MERSEIGAELGKLQRHIDTLNVLIDLVKTIPNQKDTKVKVWLDDLHKYRTQFIGDVIRLRLDDIDIERGG